MNVFVYMRMCLDARGCVRVHFLHMLCMCICASMMLTEAGGMVEWGKIAFARVRLGLREVRYQLGIALGLTWIHWDSLGFTATHLDSFGLAWTHLASLGLTWSNFGLL